MKKKLILLGSITVLSFVIIAIVITQNQEKVDDKVELEHVKAEIPAKCVACPTKDKCLDYKVAPAEAGTKVKKKVVKKN